MFIRKKYFLIAAIALAFTGSAFAYAGSNSDSFQPGLYVGAQGGFARADEGNGVKQSIDHTYTNILATKNRTRDIKQGGLGWRVYAGYAFNPYLSLETGYTHYPENRYNTSGSTSLGAAVSQEFKVSTYSADLMGKATLPLYRVSQTLQGFSIYGKAGLAYVHSEVNGSNNSPTSLYEGSEANNAWRPAFAVGIGYNFDQSLGLDLSWTTILGKSKTEFVTYPNGTYNFTNANNFTPSTNLFALGVTFKFINL